MTKAEAADLLKLADTIEDSLKGYARYRGRVAIGFDPADYDKMVAAMRLAARQVETA